MSLIVYHGGSAFDSSKITRSFESKNSGSIGYYVTTDKNQASAYGEIQSYMFLPRAEMSEVKLKKSQLKSLVKLTRYWESYSENKTEAIKTAVNNLSKESTHDVFLELINATGEIKKVIDWFVSNGISHAKISESVSIVIDPGALV